MATDRYTKTVLTVIAAALVTLAAQNATREATAQQPSLNCPITAPCYVANTGTTALYVVEGGAAGAPGGPRIRGISPNSGQPK